MKEYRREGGTEAGSKKKKKRQIGQLSDRLIKKQEAAAALESQKNRQTPPANSLGSKPKRPTASSSAATATNDEGVRPVAPLTSSKTLLLQSLFFFQKVGAQPKQKLTAFSWWCVIYRIWKSGSDFIFLDF